jgi:uncharacterized protein YndB with AHSA1/START domain
MTMQASDTAVRRSITVRAPIERAFSVFTDGIGSWWNPEHHLIETKEMVFDPFVGGHVRDVGVDGNECRWSRVLAYDKPNRIVFSWDIALDWTIETDPERTSEIEVRFTAEGPDRTLVELEHRNLERHGDGWESMRSAVDAPNGWNLEPFADAVATA